MCSEHSLKGRGPEERLGRPAASSPSLGSRGRFRAVAMVARSLGHLSMQSLPCAGDASVKQPGMKYRYGLRGWLLRVEAASPPPPSGRAGEICNPLSDLDTLRAKRWQRGRGEELLALGGLGEKQHRGLAHVQPQISFFTTTGLRCMMVALPSARLFLLLGGGGSGRW